MKPSTSIAAFFDTQFKVPVEVHMQRTFDSGFRRLDMNFWDWCYDQSLSPFCGPDWKQWVEQVGVYAERMGAVFTQAHADVYNFCTEDRQSWHEEQIRRSIEGAGMLHIPWIVLHPCAGPDFLEPGGEEKAIAESAEYFRAHAERAAKWNVGLALENMSNAKRALTTADQLNRLVDMIDMPNVGVCWDTGHANLSGQDQPAAIRALKGRLHALHIADNFGVNDDHMPPYFGIVDWNPILDALRETGYDGDFTFEAHMIARRVPEPMKADAMRLLYRLGVAMAEEI